jgi:hypothetical protein
MIKLEKGQTVYTVGEAWRNDDYIARVYYKVFKCKVDLVPREGLREYRLLSYSKPTQVFFRTRSNVYETYAGALEEAKAEADREDARNKMYKINKRTYRPWENGRQLQMVL